MTAAYGHGVMASLLGKSLDEAISSWSTAGGSEVPTAREREVARGWYMREHCTWRPATERLFQEWLPR